MRNFIKSLPFKKALIAYAITFLILTVIGWNFNIGWYGFKFSLPILGIALIVDFILTYIKYKKWLKV